MTLFSVKSGQARVRLVQGGATLVSAALISGCGTNYRPVVTPITPSGPAAQPSSYVLIGFSAVAHLGGHCHGIDYSGDTVWR